MATKPNPLTKTIIELVPFETEPTYSDQIDGIRIYRQSKLDIKHEVLRYTKHYAKRLIPALNELRYKIGDVLAYVIPEPNQKVLR